MCRLTNHGNKTRTERKGLPAFSCLVEILDHTTWRMHPNVAASVDAIFVLSELRGGLLFGQQSIKLIVRFETPLVAAPAAAALSHHGQPWLAKLFEMAKSMHVHDSCM